MKINLTLKRYLIIPAMIPVMLILWNLVLSADRLHAWRYSENFNPPTQVDHSYAAFAFSTALLTPLIIGLIAATIAHQKKYRPCWPVLETIIVGSIYLMSIAGMFFSNLFMKIENLAFTGIIGACFIAGGVIVTLLINIGTSIRQHKLGKFVLSVLILIGAILYQFWLYAFIIYVDT